MATEFAGLGGNVNYIKPVAEYKKFIPVHKGRNTFGFRVLGSWISGYGGQVAPPFDRFYMGGDTDIRGFDIRAISPVAFFPTAVTIPLQNPDGSSFPWIRRIRGAGLTTSPFRLNRSSFLVATPTWSITSSTVFLSLGQSRLPPLWIRDSTSSPMMRNYGLRDLRSPPCKPQFLAALP